MKRARMLNLFVALSLFITPVVYAENKNVPDQNVQEPLTRAQAQQALAAIISDEQQVIGLTRGVLGDDVSRTQLMTKDAQKELQLDELIPKITLGAQTIAGKWAINDMTKPITDDPSVVLERQKIMKHFLEHEDMFAKMLRSLHAIADAEKALWKYWSDAEEKESARLFNRASGLYYKSIPSPSWISSDWFDVNAWLNSKHWALKVVPYVDLGRKIKDVLFAAGFYHFTQKFGEFMFGANDDIIVDPAKVLADSLYSVARRHDPRPFLFDENREIGVRNGRREMGKEYEHNFKDYRNAMGSGSLGDKLKAAWQGYNHEGMNLPFVGKILPFQPCDQMPFLKKWFWRYVGVSSAVAGVIGMDMYLAWALKQSYDGGKHLLSTMKDLRKHLVSIARGVERLQECYSLLIQDPVLKDHQITQDLAVLFDKNQKKLQEILTLLSSDTFRNTAGILFDRGKVLWTHRLIQNSRDVFKPVLRAIGQLDAYCTMSRLVKGAEHRTNKYSFVTFVNSEAPILEINNGWSPLINGQVVNNSIEFGNNHPQHVIITGPNGGGKSGMLYAIGNIIALGQSWGIVPADSVRMSWFDRVCTSFNPRESMQNDLSTFMAQQKSMDSIYNQVNVRAQQKVAILVDEPYNGTVDAERAVRTYQFGRFLADKHNIISCIATHVEKPVSLAHDYPQAFANYQQEIVELSSGVFKRTYRLLPGDARWWFDDAERRSRYVDWLKNEHEQNLTAAAA